MAYQAMNSLVGITDYDEGTNLSQYLISHGWNADHAVSAEQVLEDNEDQIYGLIVLDEEILSESQFSVPDYLEQLGEGTPVLVLTEPGTQNAPFSGYDGVGVLQHPYTFESLRMAIDDVVKPRYCDDADLAEEGVLELEIATDPSLRGLDLAELL